MLMTGSNRASVCASVWHRWLFTDVQWSWWSLWKSAAHRPASHCWWWILALFAYLLLILVLRDCRQWMWASAVCCIWWEKQELRLTELIVVVTMN